jgi:hypothetical protein
VLIKAVLEGIPIYWNSIETIPKGVLDHIQRIIFHFLWAGQNSPGGSHLANWKSIVAPKEMGGWGLKNIRLFARALAGRNLWRLTLGNTLWVRVLNSKYFPNLSISEWFREPMKSSKGSIVWKALVEAFPLVGKWMVWCIGNGEKVRLGEDPWLGAGNNYKLSPPLLQFLKDKNLRFLSDINTWLSPDSREIGLEERKILRYPS